MSEQSKASPGPWEYDESSGAISDSQGRIALLYARDGAQVMHANGQLMASAWEMAQAGEWVLNVLCGIGKDGNPPSEEEQQIACDALRSALAKAGR